MFKFNIKYSTDILRMQRSPKHQLLEIVFFYINEEKKSNQISFFIHKLSFYLNNNIIDTFCDCRNI